MGAVLVTMAILLIPGDRKNNTPSGFQDRSCSIPPKIHLASDARPRSLIQQPEDAEPLCHLLPQGRTAVCLCPSVRLHFADPRWSKPASKSRSRRERNDRGADAVAIAVTREDQLNTGPSHW